MDRTALVTGLVLALAATARAGDGVIVTTGGPGLTPAGLAQRYDASPVLERGITGTGARIAVVTSGDVSLPDVAAFRQQHGLPPRNVDRVGAGSMAQDSGATILLEWAGALAPGADLTAIVDDPWMGLTTAILDEVAPIVVVPALDGDAPPDVSVLFIVRILYDRRLVARGTFAGRISGRTIAEFLLQLAETRGQTILVPAGSPLAGRHGVVAVGGTVLTADGEAAAPGTAAGADVATLSSATDPGYTYVWEGTPRCCAGGPPLAATVWSGVAALLQSASPGSRSFRSFLYDAGRRQGDGGITAFDDVTLGVPPPPPSGAIVQTPPAPGFDELTGFGTPRVSGLVDALDCVNVDCGDSSFADPCARSVCVAGGNCGRVALADGTPCRADACTMGSCQAGTCAGDTPISCDDDGACTADTCEPDRGCVHGAILDAPTCSLVRSRADADRRCSLDWLVEAGSDAGTRRVTCTDGDPACDADGEPGQCTFAVSVCASPSCQSLRRARPHASQSPDRAQVRRALSDVLAGGLATGECTATAPLVVRAGTGIGLRVSAERQTTRTLRLVCRAS